MSVTFTRTITPNSGHFEDTLKFAKKRVKAIKKAYGGKIKINARFGGPAGQLTLVSYHDCIEDLEKIRRQVRKGVAQGKIPQATPGFVKSVEDAIWMEL